MSLQEIDVQPDQQYIDQLKIKVKIQEIQETALLIHLSTISLPILLSKFFTLDFIKSQIRLSLIIIYIFILISVQFCTESISNKPLKYVIFYIHLITKVYIIFCLCKIKIFESFLIVMSIAYLSIYCFLKTRDIIKGHNDLLVKYYRVHIVTISFLTTFLLVQELYYKWYVIPIYWLFMILYMMFVLLNLQLVEHREYLWQNNDIYTTSVLIDSDLIAPANLLKLQNQIKRTDNHQEVQKQEVIEDSEIEELEQSEI
ncbi:unnamed protein product [Paramecium sonneborni]|uniref:Transmembrane protein n=1 Tax=Paramecium sonneborni TaxID=65129 RepID=A0A8S1Q050_9CILI|nr:unnamed protein product [Paramecium sonneborni]